MVILSRLRAHYKRIILALHADCMSARFRCIIYMAEHRRRTECDKGRASL